MSYIRGAAHFFVQTIITAGLIGAVNYKSPEDYKGALKALALSCTIAALARSLFLRITLIKHKEYSFCLFIITGSVGAAYSLPWQTSASIAFLLATINHYLNRPVMPPTKDLKVIKIA